MKIKKSDIIISCLGISLYSALEILFALAYKTEINSFTYFKPHMKGVSYEHLKIWLFFIFSLYIVTFFPIIFDNLKFRFKYRNKNKCYFNLRPNLIVFISYFLLNVFIYNYCISFPEKFIIGFILFSCPLLSVFLTATIFLGNNSILLINRFSLHNFSLEHVSLNDGMISFFKQNNFEKPIFEYRLEHLKCKRKKGFVEKLERIINTSSSPKKPNSIN